MEIIKEYLYKQLHIPFEETLTLSVSGGVDSMVMLDMVAQLKYPLVVVNFNHQKRLESINEAQLVLDYCKSRDIKCYIEKINVNGSNFQEKARIERKRKLEHIAEVNNSKYILTAHHADDLMETILMKISRGSNLYGYAGMQMFTPGEITYIKPLLYTSKTKILEYANTRQIAYLEDGSNFTDDYTRNRFRHHIIPEFKTENENIIEKFILFNKQLTNAFNVVRGCSVKFLNTVDDSIDVNKFNTLDLGIKLDVLSILFEQNDIFPTELQLTKILSLLTNNKPNITYKLNSSHSFVKSYDKFSIVNTIPMEYDEHLVEFGKPIHTNIATFTFLSNLGENQHEHAILCYNKLAFPLKLRNRKDGDVLELTYGHKKLKDFLIDKKIPKAKRDALYLLVDDNNKILWIPNLYINKNLGNQNNLYLALEEHDVKWCRKNIT